MAKIRALKPEFFTDEKIVDCSPLARLLYQGMWVHACDHGHIRDKPRQLKLRILPADDCSVVALIDELVAADLVQRHDGWLIIPTLARHQKPDKRWFLTCDFPGCKDDKPVLTTRREEPADPEEVPPDPLSTLTPRSDHYESTSGPHRGHVGGTRGLSTDGDGDGDGDGDDDVSSSPKKPSQGLRPDVESLLDHLDGCIKANGAKVPGRTRANIDAARLLIDRDGRDVDEIHTVIDWATSDEFWRTNILSMSKLRAQYDQLNLKRTTQPRPRFTRQQETDDLFAAAARRMGVTPQPLHNHLTIEGTVA